MQYATIFIIQFSYIIQNTPQTHTQTHTRRHTNINSQIIITNTI
jgi:hypothetical protein